MEGKRGKRIIIKKGILSKPSGQTANITISKNQVIRCIDYNNKSAQNEKD